MPPQVPPLDEQEFDQPALLAGLPGQRLDAGNNLFWYFTSSPWFEPQSINISVFQNVQLLPDGQNVMNDRTLWEERLRAVEAGVQFIATADPQGEGQPWVLQRQNKRHHNDTGRLETHVEGTWYTQGTRMLMAPSLLDVVQSRLLTVATRMQLMADTALSMAQWSPATGYSYYPPSHDASKPTAGPTSRAASPVLASSDPDAVVAQQSTGVPTTAVLSDALLMQSLNLAERYGDEFIDENPLKGEPGAFVFENTKTAVDARNKAHHEQAAQPPPHAVAPTADAAATSTKIDTRSPSAPPSAAPTPGAATTPAATTTAAAAAAAAAAPEAAPSRKSSLAIAAGSKKRDKTGRKTQAGGGSASPTTTTTTTTPSQAN